MAMGYGERLELERRLAAIEARIAAAQPDSDPRIAELEARIAALEARKKPGPKPKGATDAA